MDNITALEILQDQQKDFIRRKQNKSDLLNCKREDLNSELITISGKELQDTLRFCWNIIAKYQDSDPETNFKNNLIGKLGECAVKSFLGSLISEVNFAITSEGDGSIDFVLVGDYSSCIQVKTSSKEEWSINPKEIEKNKVLICVQILEKINLCDIKSEYNLVLTGFLPTNQIKHIQKIRVYQLLYIGGLRTYLKNLLFSKRNIFLEKAQEDKNNHEIENAINCIIEALKINPDDKQCYDLINQIATNDKCKDTKFNQKNSQRIYIEYAKTVVEFYDRIIEVIPNLKAYRFRAKYRRYIDLEGAIEDCDQILKENPDDYEVIKWKAEIFEKKEDYKNAIENYLLLVQQNNQLGYIFKIANIRERQEDYITAIRDYSQLLEIYPDSKHEIYINIGNIFKKINKEEEVIKAYQKSLENLGSASSTHYELYEYCYVSLVDFYSERENFISVCNQLEKIIPTDPSYRIEFLYNCSQYFEEIGNKEKARENYITIKEIYDQNIHSINSDIHAYYVLILFALQDKLDNILPYLEKIPTASWGLKNNQNILYAIGKGLLFYKQHEKARQFFMLALRREENYELDSIIFKHIQEIDNSL